MATEPTLDLVEIASQNVTLPNSTSPNKIEPNTAKQATGYDITELLGAQDFNYLMGSFFQHIRYSKQRIDELQALIEQERIAVGGLYLSTVATNPATLLGYGTWEAYGAGRALLGAGTHTDSRGEALTFALGASGGTYSVVQEANQVGQHNHPINISTEDAGAHTHNLNLNSSDGDDGIAADAGASIVDGTVSTQAAGTHSHNITGNTDNSVDTQPMSIQQPSIAVNVWRRTA